MDEIQNRISIARLLRPHGVKGDIKAEPLTHEPGRLRKLSCVSLQLSDGTIRDAQIVQATSHGDLWHLRFAGFESPEAASALNNALVQIPESERLPAPEGLFYPSDLVGLRVLDQNGTPRGKVLGLLELPSVNSFELRVDGKDILAPWIPSCILGVDLQARTVQVDFSFLADVYPEIQKGG